MESIPVLLALCLQEWQIFEIIKSRATSTDAHKGRKTKSSVPSLSTRNSTLAILQVTQNLRMINSDLLTSFAGLHGQKQRMRFRLIKGLDRVEKVNLSIL